METSFGMILGSLIGSIANFGLNKLLNLPNMENESKDAIRESCDRQGLLLSSGLITGESVVGVLIAIPIVISGKKDVLAFFGNLMHQSYPGIVLFVFLSIFMIYIILRKAIQFRK